MKTTLLLYSFFVFSCAGEPPVESAICNREVECAEYPAWQTEWTFDNGYSNYECEPCWYEFRHTQKGVCCSCNPEKRHTWCDEEGIGIYHCSPSGYFEHENCASYCVRALGDGAWFTNDDVCVDIDGLAICDCGE